MMLTQSMAPAAEVRKEMDVRPDMTLRQQAVASVQRYNKTFRHRVDELLLHQALIRNMPGTGFALQDAPEKSDAMKQEERELNELLKKLGERMGFALA